MKEMKGAEYFCGEKKADPELHCYCWMVQKSGVVSVERVVVYPINYDGFLFPSNRWCFSGISYCQS